MLELVVYTSPNCVPCATLKPELVKLQEIYQFPLRFVMASPKTQAVFAAMQIRSAPTVTCMKGGKCVGMFVGAKTPDALHEQLVTWGIIK